MKKTARNLAIALMAMAQDTTAQVVEMQLIALGCYVNAGLERIRALGGRGSGR